MVVQGIIALALALPTGMLFGVGYGTGVRIGYEQVYPLLFPKDSQNRNVTPTVDNIRNINKIYDTIGGKEASQMGIAVGLSGAMSELNNNPDFQDLMALESAQSGLTQSNFEKQQASGQTSSSSPEVTLSDFKDDKGFLSATDPALYSFILKEQGNNAQTETNFNERKVKLRILIQKMSTSQIKNAYSDMLSGRLQPSWAQQDSQFKQILTLEYKKTLAGTKQINPTLPSTTSFVNPQDVPDAALEFQKQLTILGQASLKAKVHYLDIKRIAKSQPGGIAGPYGKRALPPREAAWKAAQRKILNLIVLARNVPATKSIANTHYNNRYWLKF